MHMFLLMDFPDDDSIAYHFRQEVVANYYFIECGDMNRHPGRNSARHILKASAGG